MGDVLCIDRYIGIYIHTTFIFFLFFFFVVRRCVFSIAGN